MHDGIFCKAGGERVLLNMHKAFPDAPIYTSMYDPVAAFPEFQQCDIRVSGFNKIAKNEKQFKSRFFPFAIISMQKIDLSEYDTVIMTTTHCAKYVKCSPKSNVIAYCFTPFRLAWNPSSYTLFSKAHGLKKMAINIVVNILKKIDYKHAQKISNYLAMTDETSERIKNAYNFNKEIPIIKPTINTNKFALSETNDNYYLVVSRLEKYKKVDLVIDAFNELGLPLIVVGRGVEKKLLQEKAKDNVTFLEGISDEELIEKYRNCKAFIFPQHEDYGLTPLEANACGKPVIAYAKGGVIATQIPYSKSNVNEWTSIFFNKQDVKELRKAVLQFSDLTPNHSFIREHSEKFDDSQFIKKIQDYINSKISK